MLSKHMGVFFIGILVLLILPLVACGKAESETLSEILDQAANVTLVKYDWVMSVSQGTLIVKVWVKGNKWRIEGPPQEQTEEQGYLIDTEANTAYSWSSPGNILAEESITPGHIEIFSLVNAMSWVKGIAASNPKIVGTEIIDGKACLVVEYVSWELPGKAWLWKEHPFLVRVEVTAAERKTTYEFKNIEFRDIPDSIFERP